jgi:hypothetical protein
VDSADYNPYWLLYLGAIVLAGRYWKNAQDHGLETPTSLCFNNSEGHLRSHRRAKQEKEALTDVRHR